MQPHMPKQTYSGSYSVFFPFDDNMEGQKI
jgi:hypothetical protein